MISQYVFEQLTNFFNIKSSAYNSWNDVFSGHDIEIVDKAVKEWINTKSTKPTPNDILELVLSIEKSRQGQKVESKEEKIKRFYFLNKKYNKQCYRLVMEFVKKESYITYPASYPICEMLKQEGFEERTIPYIDDNGEVHPFKILIKKYNNMLTS